MRKSKSKYYYNGFMTQIITNYTKYKTGDDYKKLLNEIFVDKVKIKYSIFPTFSNIFTYFTIFSYIFLYFRISHHLHRAQGPGPVSDVHWI